MFLGATGKSAGLSDLTIGKNYGVGGFLGRNGRARKNVSPACYKSEKPA
jgi:hypothetical protein